MANPVYTIPLLPGQAQRLSTTIAGQVYQLRLLWLAAPGDSGGWYLDLAAEDGTLLVGGVPLVTGTDLLAPYAYLGVGAALFVVTPGAPGQVPTYAGLGTASKLCWVAR